MDKVINKIFEKIEKEPLNERLYSDCFDCIKIIFQTDKEKSFEYNGKLRQLCLKAKKESKNWDFIQSLEEIRKESYGGLENSVNEGEPYPYYANYSDLSAPSTAVDSNRIKYRNGSAQYWWQRSCDSGSAYGVRSVHPPGDISNHGASDSYGVAPACNII